MFAFNHDSDISNMFTATPIFILVWQDVCYGTVVRLSYMYYWKREREAMPFYTSSEAELISRCLHKWIMFFLCRRAFSSHQLHWLPEKQRTDFKLTVLVYKSLHGLAPPYLSDDCQSVTDAGRRHLRSSDVFTCVVPRTQSQIGDRSFSVTRPRLWNNLPTEIRKRGTTFEHYRRLLKAFLFV